MSDHKDGCLFCQIAAGGSDTEMLYEDDDVVAFRDINPAAPVHVLIVPRRHYDDLPAAAASMSGHGDLAKIMTMVVPELTRELGLADGFRLVINTGASAGQSVGHLHVHLLGGRDLGWPPG